MPEYSADDLKKAAEFREEIHGEALAKVRAVYPCADRIMYERKRELKERLLTLA